LSSICGPTVPGPDASHRAQLLGWQGPLSGAEYCHGDEMQMWTGKAFRAPVYDAQRLSDLRKPVRHERVDERFEFG